MNESEIKDIGEKLAQEAVAAGIGSKQLRSVHQLVKTKPLPMVEAWVKRQISRSERGGRGSPRGFDVWGPLLLEQVEMFQENKQELLKVLWYTNMLYPYEEMKQGLASRRPRRTDHMSRGTQFVSIGGEGWKEKLEPVVKDQCSQYGYGGIQVRNEGRGLLCTVLLRRFYDDPRVLSSNLSEQAMNHFPELDGRIRFWIDYRR